MFKSLRAVIRLAGVLVLVAFSITIWFWHESFGDTALPLRRTQVIVPSGSTLAQIARELSDRGVIANTVAFRLLARWQGDEDLARAGEYSFEAHQSQSAVLRELITGGSQVAAWVTIPEGFTASQIAEQMQVAGIGRALSLDRAFSADSIELGGIRTRGLEGYLFPSTYLIQIGATPGQIAKRLTDQFFRELPADAAQQAQALHVTLPQAVTVASLVEREAKIDADRPLIAGVIYNRLRDRMPLQIDATIEYALPRHKDVLSFADLKIDSPYNTYLHDGLPPTPIANPGLPSLEAALHPAKTDALYYVYCGGGHHVFAKTLQEHQANVARCLK